MKIEIRNGRVVDPAQGVDRAASVYIDAGRIDSIGERRGDFHADRVV